MINEISRYSRSHRPDSGSLAARPRWSRAGARPLVAVAALLLATSCAALELTGTAWDRAARAAGLDPYLLYAIALLESPIARPGGRVSPWPYAIHTPDGPRRYPSREAALAALPGLLARYPRARLDVGLMQVNLGWHGSRVERPASLLDPATNLRIGAAILAETLASAPADPLLGLGRYHTWREEPARAYAARVERLRRRLAPQRDKERSP